MAPTTRVLASLLRMAVPVTILGWLVYRTVSDNPEVLHELWDREKNWQRLVLAAVTYVTAVLLVFFRWYLLVRALHLSFRVRDAIRLGFIGYLSQYVSLGAVGGDLFKALFIVREQPNRRPEAVASLLIDRVVGLVSLLLLTCIVFATGLGGQWSHDFQTVAYVYGVLAAVGTLLLVVPLVTNGSLSNWARPYPRVRAVLLRIDQSVHLYRTHRMWVVAAVLLGIFTHVLQATSIYLAGSAVFPQGPSWGQYVLLWSFAAAVAALPISPAGLGTFELTFNVLYEQMAPMMTLSNEGFLVSFLFRLLCLVLVFVGMIYFLLFRHKADRSALSSAEVTV